MKKFLMLLAAVAVIAAPALSLAQTMTDYEYNRLTLSNTFANEKAKPILRNADRALHAPVATLALLSDIEYDARYQGMMVNVDTGLYFYDATDCPGGSTSPTAVQPDDTNGCWYLISGAADIWAALADTTPTSGAMLVGIKDTATYYTGVTVETALAEVGAEFLTKQDLAVPVAAGNIATLDAAGQVVDSGDSLAEYSLLVGMPTNGNLVCTDALGQPYDCASAPGDYQTFAIPTAAGNVCTLSALGAVEDSTIASSNLQVLTAPAAADNLAGLDATGALTDSAIAGADVSALLAVFADQMRNSTDTAQSLADATETLLDLEDVELAGDVTYDAGVTRLATIPADGDGVYTIAAWAIFAAGAGTYRTVYARIDGADVELNTAAPDGANPDTVAGSLTAYFVAGETIGLAVKQDSGGAINVTNAQLAIQRIQ